MEFWHCKLQFKKLCHGSQPMVQQVKLLPAEQACHLGGSFSPAPLLICVPVNMPVNKVENGSNARDPVPHTGDTDEAPDTRLQLDPVLVNCPLG